MSLTSNYALTNNKKGLEQSAELYSLFSISQTFQNLPIHPLNYQT